MAAALLVAAVVLSLLDHLGGVLRIRFSRCCCRLEGRRREVQDFDKRQDVQKYDGRSVRQACVGPTIWHQWSVHHTSGCLCCKCCKCWPVPEGFNPRELPLGPRATAPRNPKVCLLCASRLPKSADSAFVWGTVDKRNPPFAAAFKSRLLFLPRQAPSHRLQIAEEDIVSRYVCTML